jgi:D-glycero-alpha-D-manno-heptose 1-phosphate guanylyltransferase
MNIPVIILAGGLGTRLRSIVNDVPKPMAPIHGRPFLEYQLAHLKDQGVRNVTLAVGYMADVIEEHFGAQWHSIIVNYSREENPLGTGGALIEACKFLPKNTSVFVLNGDTYFPASLKQMYCNHVDRGASVSIAVFKTDEEQRYSSFEVDEVGRLLRQARGFSPYKSAGIYLLSASVVDELRILPVEKTSFEEKIMNDFWSKGERLFAYIEDCPFIDIGVPDDYRRAAATLRAVSQKN